MLETNENKQKEARNSPIFDKQVYKVFVTNSGNEWFLFCLVDFQGFFISRPTESFSSVC